MSCLATQNPTLRQEMALCANYRPVTRIDRLLTFFGVERAAGTIPHEFTHEAWPTGLAPFIRRSEAGGRQLDAGHFGLLPHFAKEVAYGRRTYNARSETVHELVSFKRAWSKGQRCIVPAEAIYEPCWESGKAVRWCIQQPGEVPMGIGGIWYEHPWMKQQDGTPVLSFAMLTVSGAGHPVFKRMHRPEDEKRMVLIIEPAEYDRWLQCSVDEAATFFRQWHGALDAFPAPLARGSRKARPASEEGDPDLF
jgi:putative SOS response-associated peptidase YedK